MDFSYGNTVLKFKALYLAIPLTLIGCNDESVIHELVKKNLKDPESAQFHEFIVSDDNAMGCVEWNARNSYGGYGEYEVAEFSKDKDHEWLLTDIDSSAPCNKSEIERRAKNERAFMGAVEYAAGTMAKARGIIASELPDQCKLFAEHYGYKIQELEMYKGSGKEALEVQYLEQYLSAAEKKLHNSDFCPIPAG